MQKASPTAASPRRGSSPSTACATTTGTRSDRRSGHRPSRRRTRRLDPRLRSPGEPRGDAAQQDALRRGRLRALSVLAADTAEAFATTADTDFQRTVFEGLSQSGQFYGHNVRQALYVGLDAYRAAGGKVEDPLFEDDFLTILDPDLMLELAQQKLNAEASRYADEWKWTAM